MLDLNLKLIGICGSPRKGNSEFLLKKAYGIKAHSATIPALSVRRFQGRRILLKLEPQGTALFFFHSVPNDTVLILESNRIFISSLKEE